MRTRHRTRATSLWCDMTCHLPSDAVVQRILRPKFRLQQHTYGGEECACGNIHAAFGFAIKCSPVTEAATSTLMTSEGEAGSSRFAGFCQRATALLMVVLVLTLCCIIVTHACPEVAHERAHEPQAWRRRPWYKPKPQREDCAWHYPFI